MFHFFFFFLNDVGIYLNGEVDHLQENSIERGRYKGHRKVMKSGELDCLSK